MAGKLAQVGLQIGGQDRQNVFFYAVSLHFADQRFCPLAQFGPANFTYCFAFSDRLMLHDAKPCALLGE